MEGIWGRVAEAVAGAGARRLGVLMAEWVAEMKRGVLGNFVKGLEEQLQEAQRAVYKGEMGAEGVTETEVWLKEVMLEQAKVMMVDRGVNRGGLQLMEKELLKDLKSNYDETHDLSYLESRPVVMTVEVGRDGGDNDDAEHMVPEGTRGTDP